MELETETVYLICVGDVNRGLKKGVISSSSRSSEAPLTMETNPPLMQFEATARLLSSENPISTVLVLTT